jgi:hypothetical protein
MPNPSLLQTLLGTQRPVYEEYPRVAGLLEALTGPGARTVGAIAGGLAGGLNPVTSAVGATAGVAIPIALRQFFGAVGALPPKPLDMEELTQTAGQSVLFGAVPMGKFGRFLSKAEKVAQQLETTGPAIERLEQQIARRQAAIERELPVYAFAKGEGARAPIGKGAPKGAAAEAWIPDQAGRLPEPARPNLRDPDTRVFFGTIPRDRVYDATADPLGLIEEAQTRAAAIAKKAKPGQDPTQKAFADLLRENNFDAVMHEGGRIEIINPKAVTAHELTSGQGVVKYLQTERPWQILTHDLDTLDDATKAARYEALSNRLADEGYPFVRATGFFEGNLERSLFVPGMPTEAGLALSREGNQAYHLGHGGLVELATGKTWRAFPRHAVHGDAAKDQIAKTIFPRGRNVNPDPAEGYPVTLYIDFNDWTKHIDPAIIEALNPQQIRAVDKMLEQIPATGEEMARLVGMGRAKEFQHWYKESQELRGILGPKVYDLFARVYDALSPRMRTDKAVPMALNVTADIISGINRGWPIHRVIARAAARWGVMASQFPNLVRSVLMKESAAKAVSGPKVRDFLKSLLEEEGPGAIDGLMFVSELMKEGVTSGSISRFGAQITSVPYLAAYSRMMEGAIQEALRAGIPAQLAPAEAQAAIWSTTSALHSLVAMVMSKHASTNLPLFEEGAKLVSREVARDVAAMMRENPRVLNSYVGVLQTIAENKNAQEAIKRLARLARTRRTPGSVRQAIERKAAESTARIREAEIPPELADQVFEQYVTKLVDGLLTGRISAWGTASSQVSRAIERVKKAGGAIVTSAEETGAVT